MAPPWIFSTVRFFAHRGSFFYGLHHYLVISCLFGVYYWPKHGSEGWFWRNMRFCSRMPENSHFPPKSVIRPMIRPMLYLNWDRKWTNHNIIPQNLDSQWEKTLWSWGDPARVDSKTALNDISPIRAKISSFWQSFWKQCGCFK